MTNSKENPTTDNQGVKSDSVQADENVSVQDMGNDKPVDAIPYARFNEINKQKKDLESQLNDFKAKQEANRVKNMEEQGQYKELNAELISKVTKYEEKLDVYAVKEAKEREDLLSQLDDQDKEVYGTLGNDQLRKHLSKGQKPQSINTNTTQPVRDTSGNKVTDWTTMSPQEKRDNWGAILKSYTNKK
tara:strand:+ start:1524 stop:2087 length:564 start_codon:yes stop_codon:yes gene_type:complete